MADFITFLAHEGFRSNGGFIGTIAALVEIATVFIGKHDVSHKKRERTYKLLPFLCLLCPVRA